jgi:hypothetical protein
LQLHEYVTESTIQDFVILNNHDLIKEKYYIFLNTLKKADDEKHAKQTLKHKQITESIEENF